eukprot:1075836-Prymnesium_polylepis.2
MFSTAGGVLSLLSLRGLACSCSVCHSVLLLLILALGAARLTALSARAQPHRPSSASALRLTGTAAARGAGRRRSCAGCGRQRGAVRRIKSSNGKNERSDSDGTESL